MYIFRFQTVPPHRYKVFYPEGVNDELMSTLVTPQAFKRVKGLLDATKGEVVIGGETVEEKKFISPTIVKDVAGEDSLMSEYVLLVNDFTQGN